MSDKASKNPGLVRHFDNPDTEHPGVLMQRLNELSHQAVEIGKSISSHSKDVAALWDKLLPTLSEVQGLLSKHGSRRRERRMSGFPTWEEWRRRFLKESGLQACERTAQRHLKHYQELKGLKPKKHGSPTGRPGATPAEHYQMLSALRAAQDLVAALLEEEDPSDALTRFQAATIDPDRLLELLRNCKKPRGADIIASGQPIAGTVRIPGGIPRAHLHTVSASVSSHECGLKFRPGGWALLAEYISIEHGSQAKIVFDLPADKKMDAFMAFASKLAKILVHLDGDDDNLNLPAEYIDNDHKLLPAA
jgi:hypothetical protein